MGLRPAGGAGGVGTEFIDAALVLVPATDPPRLKDTLTDFRLLNAVLCHTVTFFSSISVLLILHAAFKRYHTDTRAMALWSYSTDNT